MSEFSEFTVLSTIPLEFTPEQFKAFIRFEYPAYRMALSELTEKSVAITKIILVDTFNVLTYTKGHCNAMCSTTVQHPLLVYCKGVAQLHIACWASNN